jgi:lipopolysaccharide transport system ATP-binding protein
MRLAFAVQVLCKPDILIIDEALSVGDFFFQQKCLGHIRGLCENGMTLLFVSHDMGITRDICNRAIYLNKGEKHFEGPVTNAIRKYISEKNNVINPAKSTQGDNVTFPYKIKNSNATILKDPIWSAEEAWDEKKPGRLLAIAVYDSTNCPIASFAIGETMKIAVAYQIKPKNRADITIALKNKFDQFCTFTGSRHLDEVPPESKDLNGIIIFYLSMDMLLEAGNYSIIVTLEKATKPNSGSDIDQAPPIGPIRVTWDYENETAPFLGQVGLPASCKFETY